MKTKERAVLFIDGSNWYHAMRDGGVKDTLGLDYARISKKLILDREWIGTRYYGVQTDQATDAILYANNRRFLSLIEEDDTRISVHLGRTQKELETNPLAKELLAFIGDNRPRLEAGIATELTALADQHRNVGTFKEKGVDVGLAVDLCTLALRNEYDVAFLLSADGDFAPAALAVQGCGKRILPVSVIPSFSSALNTACGTFIRLPGREWFKDCYR